MTTDMQVTDVTEAQTLVRTMDGRPQMVEVRATNRTVFGTGVIAVTYATRLEDQPRIGDTITVHVTGAQVAAGGAA